MAKLIKAVAPYKYKEGINFKNQAYDAWIEIGGQTSKSHYPPRILHHFAYNYELPSFTKKNNEVRLRFVEPVSLSFDTFPDYARYEIIPFIWDCWPCYFDKVCDWFKKHDVRTAIFTSSQTAERMQKRFPEMNIKYCPEGIDTSRYSAGKPLPERKIDLLEFGRSNKAILKGTFPDSLNHICTKIHGSYLYTNEQLYDLLGKAKITIALPRSMTEPEKAGDIETLTQRYWENMLSRVVIVGHAPQELIDLIGYDPVIEIDLEHPMEQILNIVAHIGDYQEMVDKNRTVAIEKGDWHLRIKNLMNYLQNIGYKI